MVRRLLVWFVLVLHVYYTIIHVWSLQIVILLKWYFIFITWSFHNDIAYIHQALYLFMTSHRFIARVTPRVRNVEQELFTLPEHLDSSTVFSGVRVARSFVLLCNVLWIIVCPCLTIVLSVLWFTSNDYPFGVF